MNEQQFYQTLNEKAKEFNLNPLLLISGIEGLYTFRDVPINTINYELLDSLILTIFALRIGDQFHTIAEQNLMSANETARRAASIELQELTPEEISTSNNPYFQSFASVMNGKGTIRKYHEKALDVAALEIKQAQHVFQNSSIGIIILAICKDDLNGSLNFGALFSN